LLTKVTGLVITGGGRFADNLVKKS